MLVNNHIRIAYRSDANVHRLYLLFLFQFRENET